MNDALQLSTSGFRTRDRAASPDRRLAFGAGAIAVLVIAVAGWSVFGYFDSISRLSRGSAPGTVPVTADAGRVVVYYEGHGTPTLSDLDLRVTGPAGEPVRLEAFPYDLRYDVDNLVGRAVAAFDAPSAGTYVVTSRISEPGARLAVGGDMGGATLLMVFALIGALFVLAVGVVVGLLWVVTARARPPLARSLAR